MRPVRIVAALVFAATAALLAPLAAPAWAGPAPTLQVSPGSVTAGDRVVVSGSVGPEPAGSACATGVLLLSSAFVHTDDFAGVPAVAAAVRPDGTFTVTTRIPRSRPAGTYTISGRCGGGNLGISATLVVRAAPTPTTTAPPVTRPAGPATGPQATAPAGTQPAASRGDQLAGRWIIPGLVALASGTLAALGVWLPHRRRHPAGLGR
jgi:hypothetical protein